MVIFEVNSAALVSPILVLKERNISYYFSSGRHIVVWNCVIHLFILHPSTFKLWVQNAYFITVIENAGRNSTLMGQENFLQVWKSQMGLMIELKNENLHLLIPKLFFWRRLEQFGQILALILYSSFCPSLFRPKTKINYLKLCAVKRSAVGYQRAWGPQTSIGGQSIFCLWLLYSLGSMDKLVKLLKHLL